MESTAFENSSISDGQGLSQNVSAEPYSNFSPGTKSKTEEFLRRESGFIDTENPQDSEESLTTASIKNESVDLESGIDLVPELDSFKAMEMSGGNVELHTDETNTGLKLTGASEEIRLVEPYVDDSLENTGELPQGISDNNFTFDSNAPQLIEQDIESGKDDEIATNSYVPPETEVKDSSNQETNEEAQKEKEEWLDILGSGHLLKKVLKPGEPESRPNKSDLCVISYTGQLENGTVVESAENIKIHLSDNEVVQGIDFALALMEKGEEAELKVGPRFAYGSLGKQPNIPPGATIVYNVKLLDVQEDTPINTLPINERILFGQKKKERGNFWYSREEHSIAINCYRRALEFLDDTDIPEPHDEEDIRKLIDERLKTYNNLTASQMKIHAYDAALMSVNYVLASQPQNVKALFRKSKILKEKGDISEAIKVVRLALSFDKDSKSLQQELSSLLAVQRKDNSKQRELYKKMLGNSASQDKDGKGKSSKSTYSTIKWTSLLAFAAVVVAGTVALKYKM